MGIKQISDLLKTTYRDWTRDRASQLAAALSYYTIFSLAPILLLIISILGIIIGQAEVQKQLLVQVKDIIGDEGAAYISTLLHTKNQPSGNIIGTIIGLLSLLLGALGVFSQLKTSFNQIWHIDPVKKNLPQMVKDNILSFGMVVSIGFLLLISLIISALITALGTYFTEYLPLPSTFFQVINLVVSFGIITILFALIFKLLPDIKIKWTDVWIGALFTSALFTIGKYLIGFYLAHSVSSSQYGAAGSLVVLILWFYYSAQILFFGAEFTKTYAYRYGSLKKKEEHISKTAQVVGSFVEGFVKVITKSNKR